MTIASLGSESPRIAGYPTRLHALRFGSLSVQVHMVRQLEDFVDTEALLRDADAPEPPYWAHLWPGSRSLADFVATDIECSGRCIAEIGCGLGVAGIVAALRGGSVTLIDHIWEGVCFAAANAAVNGCRVRVVQADIRSPGLRGQFDYCLAGDVTYDPQLQEAVAGFLAVHLAPGGAAWCAESVRTLDRGLRRSCERYGLQVSERTVGVTDEQGRVPLHITEVRRRP